jgi:uncharacterized protein YndB with AHSA1/START domain
LRESRPRAADPAGSSAAAFRTQRTIPYTRDAIFGAFTRPEVLARWWGPAGFTNTFETFDFRPGGRWKYVMHGPKGTHHPNESEFVEVSPSRIVIHHVSPPRYRLAITLTEAEGRTELSWDQAFEDAAVAARIRHIVEPANEQNLDRLAAVLAEA